MPDLRPKEEVCELCDGEGYVEQGQFDSFHRRPCLCKLEANADIYEM